MMKLGAVFIVHIDGAFAIGSGEFGLAAQVDVAEYGTVGGVDGGGVFAAAVEGEDALGDGVVKNGVGIAVGLDVATDGLQRFQVKDGDIVRAAIAGEAAAEVGSDGDAVDALGVGNVADNGVGVRIENHSVSAPRDVNATSVTVHIDVIPTTIAAHGNSFDDVIAGAGRSRCGRMRKAYNRKGDGNGKQTENAEQRETFIHDFLSLNYCLVSSQGPTTYIREQINAG